ncbi:MAG: SprT family zinc-dependent metalloprotease [Pseudomonadota bacterium]
MWNWFPKPLDNKNTLPLPDGVIAVPNPRARRMALRLDPVRKCVRLVYPPRTAASTLLKFVQANQRWIAHHLASLPQDFKVQNGASIPLLGVKTSLAITLDETLKRTSIKLINNELIIKTNLDDPTPRLRRFLDKALLERLRILCAQKSDQLGRPVINIQIRDSKSRWGSCGHDGRLCFSRRLVYVPENVLDYVVAHEIAHLKHMDHSDAFWSTCADLCVDYAGGKTWLKAHGASLHAYP